MNLEERDLLHRGDDAVTERQLAQMQQALQPRTMADLKTGWRGLALKSPTLKEKGGRSHHCTARQGFHLFAEPTTVPGLVPHRQTGLLLQKPSPVLPNISNSEEGVDPEDANILKEQVPKRVAQILVRTRSQGSASPPINRESIRFFMLKDHSSSEIGAKAIPSSARKKRKTSLGQGTPELTDRKSGERAKVKSILKKAENRIASARPFQHSISARLEKRVSFDQFKTVFRFKKETIEAKKSKKAPKTSRNYYQDSD